MPQRMQAKSGAFATIIGFLPNEAAFWRGIGQDGGLHLAADAETLRALIA